MTFRELYRRHWAAFVAYYRTRSDLSPPLLLSLSEAYVRQRTKLFVVGQQARGWCDRDPRIRIDETGKAIDVLMRVYRDDFRLGLAVGSHRRSAFWRFIRQVEQGLDVEKGAIAWSSLDKVSQAGGAVVAEVREAIQRCFPVLPKEILLARPDVVCFLTGPSYDSVLQQVFAGSRLQAVDGLDGRLARVECAGVLPERSFRTYHPNHIQRSRQWEDVLGRLLTLCRG